VAERRHGTGLLGISDTARWDTILDDPPGSQPPSGRSRATGNVTPARYGAAVDDTGTTRQDACVWLEVSEHGLISRVVDYWPEPYDPPPGREHLVERW